MNLNSSHLFGHPAAPGCIILSECPLVSTEQRRKPEKISTKRRSWRSTNLGDSEGGGLQKGRKIIF